MAQGEAQGPGRVTLGAPGTLQPPETSTRLSSGALSPAVSPALAEL